MTTSYDVAIIGGGMNFASHLTLEACDVLGQARLVYHAFCLDDVRKRLVELAGNATVINVDEGHYQFGQYRPDMYREMATVVVRSAEERGGVALIEPGNPFVTDCVTQHTLSLAEERGLRVQVVPGISSAELVFCEFCLDPSEGLQVILAQELVRRRIQLNPQLSTIVLQPWCYDTLWWTDRRNASQLDRYSCLFESLRRSYSEDTPMALVRFPTHGAQTFHKIWFRLRDFAVVVAQQTALHTLFIPSVEETVDDLDFTDRIHSLERRKQFIVHSDGADGTDGAKAGLDAATERRLLDESKVLADWWQHGRIQRNLRRIEPPG